MPKRLVGCSELLKATDLSPADRALVLSLRSDAHASQRNVDGAIADLKRATELQPDDAALRERLAIAYVRRSDERLSRNELPGAIEDLSEGIKYVRDTVPLRERIARLHEARGRQLDESGDRKGAIEAYGKAIEFDAKRAELHALRGKSRMAADDNDGAVMDFTEALAIQPDSVEFLIRRGEALLKSGDRTKAILDFNRVIQLDPKNITAHLLRGNAFESGGADKRSDAHRAYEAALAIEPTNEIARRALARLGTEGVAKDESSDASVELVRDIQGQLKRLGCYSGELDGKWGKGSVSALEKYLRMSTSKFSASKPSEAMLRTMLAEPSQICKPDGRKEPERESLMGKKLLCSGGSSGQSIRVDVEESTVRLQWPGGDQHIFTFGHASTRNIDATTTHKNALAKMIGDNLRLSMLFVKRKSDFLNGATHYVENLWTVSRSGSDWKLQRNARQWSSDGGKMFYPRFSEAARCKLSPEGE